MRALLPSVTAAAPSPSRIRHRKPTNRQMHIPLMQSREWQWKQLRLRRFGSTPRARPRPRLRNRRSSAGTGTLDPKSLSKRRFATDKDVSVKANRAPRRNRVVLDRFQVRRRALAEERRADSLSPCPHLTLHGGAALARLHLTPAVELRRRSGWQTNMRRKLHRRGKERRGDA